MDISHLPSGAQIPENGETAKSGRLNDDLYRALQKTESKFSNNFYYTSTEISAPNPGLCIDGLGPIGLPLNEQEAQSLISKASRSKSLGDGWEIDPSKVTFANPDWESYVDSTATTVRSTLGVAARTTPPRCELHKLLLYQPGHKTYLHRHDAARAPGLFATIVFVLPSPFKGGEVHVSQAGKTKVLDIAQTSGNSTSILAWYDDVAYEVKPITSGYRLALSYNFVHTSPDVVSTALPEQTDTPLYQCLRKWKRGGFATVPKLPLVVHLLDHTYSSDDFKNGRKHLKGKDAHTIGHLLPPAETLGIAVYLAELVRTVTRTTVTECESNSGSDFKGDSDSDDWNYRSDSDWGHRSDSDSNYNEDEEYTIGKITHIENRIRSVTRIDEGRHVDFDFDQFEIAQDCLTAEDPFDGVEPEDQEYDRSRASVDQYWDSSVLMLFRLEDLTSIGVSLKGYPWGFSRLQVGCEPDPKAEEIVCATLESIEKRELYHSSEGNAKVIIAHALAWKRPDLWNRAIRHCGPALETAKAAIAEALKVFGLDSIKSSLGFLVQRNSALRVRFSFIHAIVEQTGSSGLGESLADDAFSTCNSLSSDDVPTVLEIAKGKGVGFIETSILSDDANARVDYRFLMTLAQALQKDCSGTESSKPLLDETKADLMGIIRRCITIIILRWDGPSRYMNSGGADDYHVSEVMRLCIRIEDLELCSTVAIRASKAGSYASRMAAAKTLHDYLNTLPQTDDHADEREKLGKTARTCVVSAMSCWQGADMPGGGRGGPRSNIHHLVQYCFDINQLDLCTVFFNTIIKETERSTNYEPLVGLADALQLQIARMKNPDSHPAADLSAENAVQKWERSSGGRNSDICRLVDLCLTIDHLSPCVTMLNALLKTRPGEDYDYKVPMVYLHLVAPLKATLAKHGKPMTLEPFGSFFRLIISLYLSHVLAPKTPSTIWPTLPMRSAGCGACSHCNDLDRFLKSESKEIRFKAAKKFRTHIETEIYRARIDDIVSGHTLTGSSTHVLVVTRRPHFMEQIAWSKIRSEAKAVIGRVVEGDDQLEAIMLDRHNDVLEALQGTKTFAFTGSPTIPLAVVQTAPDPEQTHAVTNGASHSSSSKRTTTTTASSASSSLTGVKRKHDETSVSIEDRPTKRRG